MPFWSSAFPSRPFKLLANTCESIGDAFEFWSSCKYKSTLHRVISPPYKEGVQGHDRFSMAFFCQPVKDAVLKAVVPPREVSAGMFCVDDGDETD